MAYVAVKGGEKAIHNAQQLLRSQRRGDRAIPELSLEQIQQQLSLAVNRVMAEGSLYDPELVALAIKQSWGDLVEAIFLLRAYRTTLPRLYYSQPLDTNCIHLQRRISAIFKDVPGGQCLGPTYDYVHRLLDFKLAAEGSAPHTEPKEKAQTPSIVTNVADVGECSLFFCQRSKIPDIELVEDIGDRVNYRLDMSSQRAIPLNSDMI